MGPQECLGCNEVLPGALMPGPTTAVPGNQVYRTLQAKRRLRAASATVGPGRWLIGDDTPPRRAWPGFVRPGEAMAGRSGTVGVDMRKYAPRSANLHPQAEQSAIPLYCCLNVYRMPLPWKASRFAQRSSTHFTGRPRRMARYGMAISSEYRPPFSQSRRRHLEPPRVCGSPVGSTWARWS